MPKVKAFLFIFFLCLFAGCEVNEANQRGFVISKVQELPAEEPGDNLVQP